MAGKRKRLAQRRKSCGFTQETFAQALRVDRTTVQRWKSGEVEPHPHQRLRMANLLQIEPEELHALLAPETSGLPLLNGDRGEGLALTIREMSQRLVMLDNELNGLPIADVAARSFKKVHRRLGEGKYDRKAEHDIQAAAAELAEVAGWALFDAEKQGSARRFNQEALFLARLSGDRAIELLIMQNMAMQAGWVEAEDVAESLILTTGEISSARTLRLLAKAAQNGKSTLAAPSNLRDALDHIESAIREDPYEM
ncbi:helix-turn-helix transcriptional regulator [Streptomyces sp. NPDC059477]|uniref:helix-turn-helix transcriptional regulator n=1 Tax=Streptomyces sp. NPDC059477 TaxID=3346847 RepID=UPI0036963EF2